MFPLILVLGVATSTPLPTDDFPKTPLRPDGSPTTFVHVTHQVEHVTFKVSVVGPMEDSLSVTSNVDLPLDLDVNFEGEDIEAPKPQTTPLNSSPVDERQSQDLVVATPQETIGVELPSTPHETIVNLLSTPQEIVTMELPSTSQEILTENLSELASTSVTESPEIHTETVEVILKEASDANHTNEDIEKSRYMVDGTKGAAEFRILHRSRFVKKSSSPECCNMSGREGDDQGSISTESTDLPVTESTLTSVSKSDTTHELATSTKDDGDKATSETLLSDEDSRRDETFERNERKEPADTSQKEGKPVSYEATRRESRIFYEAVHDSIHEAVTTIPMGLLSRKASSTAANYERLPTSEDEHLSDVGSHLKEPQELREHPDDREPFAEEDDPSIQEKFLSKEDIYDDDDPEVFERASGRSSVELFDPVLEETHFERNATHQSLFLGRDTVPFVASRTSNKIFNSSTDPGLAVEDRIQIEPKEELRVSEKSDVLTVPRRPLGPGSIVAIVLSVLLFVGAIAGVAGYIFYQRRFCNRPKVLSDRSYANSDSGGYIDDSCRGSYVNSHLDIPKGTPEDLISLDNDSFLNSLESMTIQNLWTDNIRHTKL